MREVVHYEAEDLTKILEEQKNTAYALFKIMKKVLELVFNIMKRKTCQFNVGY